MAADTLGKAVLVLNIHIQHGQHANYGHTGFFFNHAQTGTQYFHITAEFVNYYALHHRPFLGLQQHQGAIDGGEHATAVNISNQKHGGLSHLRHTHVHKIILFDVDFGRAASAFNAHDIVLAG